MVFGRLNKIRRQSGGHVVVPEVSQPSKEIGRLVVCAIDPCGLSRADKVQPHRYFPDFCKVLSREGISTKFVGTGDELEETIVRGCIVVHVYREDAVRIDTKRVLDAQRNAGLIFNHPIMGPILGRKEETHRWLTRHGVPMPSVLIHRDKIFSNAFQDSGGPVALLNLDAGLDKTRFNTSFVDTRVMFGGKWFYTTVRLLCVGREIVHAYVRAKDAEPGAPSVHARDTPLDAELIEHLQLGLVSRRMTELRALARLLGDALGPGFYAHDLLIETKTSKIFVCESGFKFDDKSYLDRIAPIANDCPSHSWMITSEFAERAAELFLIETRRLSVLL